MAAGARQPKLVLELPEPRAAQMPECLRAGSRITGTPGD